MAFTYIYKRGDTAPDITATLGDANGPFDLTGHTVRFIAAPAAAGAPPLINAVAALRNPGVGAVAYPPQVNDLSIVGEYRIEWEDIYPDGRIRRLPTDDFDVLIIKPNAEDEIAGAAAPAAVPSRPIRVDFEMIKGNRKELEFDLPLRNEKNLPIDVGAYLQVWCYGKHWAGDSDAAAVFAKTKGAGVGSNTTILVNPDGKGVNTFKAYLLPAETASLEPGYHTPLWIECRALVAVNDVRTIAVGWLSCLPGAVSAVT